MFRTQVFGFQNWRLQDFFRFQKFFGRESVFVFFKKFENKKTRELKSSLEFSKISKIPVILRDNEKITKVDTKILRVQVFQEFN